MKMSAYHPFRSSKAKEQYLALYDMKAKNWPVVSETKTVDTSWGQTFVRISGPVGAPPLVLLPGASATSLLWESNIAALSECYRTYAVDNIYDHGRSVYTRPIRNSDDFVKWLDELFSALELGDKINLMGMSLGSWLTAQYALRFPNRLDKIVLLAPAATVLPMRLEFFLRVLLSLLPFRYFVRNLMNWLLEDFAQKDEASRIMVKDWADELLIAAWSFKPKRIVKPTVLEDSELLSIKVPTLYLVGENEKIYSAEEAVQRLNKVAPQIKTEIIPNAGHDLIVVQSETVNRKVLDFLSI